MTLDSPPLVSIIIPLYNAEETIDSCLQSCLGQTYKNLEIIVIDDGSSDNSRAIVQGLIMPIPRFAPSGKTGAVSRKHAITVCEKLPDNICSSWMRTMIYRLNPWKFW